MPLQMTNAPGSRCCRRPASAASRQPLAALPNARASPSLATTPALAGHCCRAAPRPARQSIAASSSTQGESSSSQPASPPPAAVQPGFLGRIWKSLQDFGIGGRSLNEGGVGLFLLVGSGFAVALISWAQKTVFRTGQPYEATIELPLACGISVGTFGLAAHETVKAQCSACTALLERGCLGAPAANYVCLGALRWRKRRRRSAGALCLCVPSTAPAQPPS